MALKSPGPASFAWSERLRRSVTPRPRTIWGVISRNREIALALPVLADAPKWPCQTWVFYNERTGETAPFKCKSWRCPHCAPRRKGTWIARVTHLLESWPRVRFWTLTLNPNQLLPFTDLTPEQFLLRAWRVLRVHLGRRCPRCNRRCRGRPLRCASHPKTEPKTPSFVWVLEYTKKGLPHLHVAMNQYIPRGWLQAKWERLTKAWNVDVRATDPEATTTYLAKYLGKTLNRMRADRDFPKGGHIYGASLDMPITAPWSSHPDWSLIRDLEGCEALHVPAMEDVLLLQLHGLWPFPEWPPP